MPGTSCSHELSSAGEAGRADGAEQRVFHLYEVRDGKAYRCRVFVSEDEARKAAGLEHGRWA